MSSTHTLKDKFLSSGLMKLFASLLLTLVCVLGSKWFAENYYSEVGRDNTTEATNTARADSFASKNTKNVEKALESMKGYNSLMTNWSIILFGGTIGIAVLGKGAKIRDNNWALVTIPPTWVFLYYSVSNGNQFSKKVSYQYYTGNYALGDLNDPLYLQEWFFSASLVPLMVLAAVYLTFRFYMYEDKTNG